MKGDVADRIERYAYEHVVKVKEMELKIRNSTFIHEVLHANDKKTRHAIIEWMTVNEKEYKEHPDSFMAWLKESLLETYKIESMNEKDVEELKRMKNNIVEMIGFEV